MKLSNKPLPYDLVMSCICGKEYSGKPKNGFIHCPHCKHAWELFPKIETQSQMDAAYQRLMILQQEAKARATITVEDYLAQNRRENELSTIPHEEKTTESSI